jgi:hypothetical protein
LLLSRLRALRSLIVAIGLSASPLTGAPVASAAPAIFHSPQVGYSANWAGLDFIGAGRFTAAAGSFRVPVIHCTAVATYSAVWVGIDGVGSGTVEQAGIEADCHSGRAVYSAWYEFYPAASVTVSTVAVRPGDVIEVAISATSSGASLRLHNATTNKAVAISRAMSIRQASAEWTVEAPDVCARTCAPTALASFDPITFSGVAGRTDRGISGGSLTSGWTTDVTTMTDSVGRVRAKPTILSGSSFVVRWGHA